MLRLTKLQTPANSYVILATTTKPRAKQVYGLSASYLEQLTD